MGVIVIIITVEFHTLDTDICAVPFWSVAAQRIDYLIETVGINPDEIKKVTIVRETT